MISTEDGRVSLVADSIKTYGPMKTSQQEKILLQKDKQIGLLTDKIEKLQASR